MKKHWRMVLAVILCAALCIGYYYYLANRPSNKDATDKAVQNDELAYLTARNINDNYPESVRDVVKLYARITKEYYEAGITEEDIENAKKLIIASVKSITSEQDTEITYYYGQELSGTFTTITDYENKVNSVTKEQIVEIANSVSINTIYFLKD